MSMFFCGVFGGRQPPAEGVYSLILHPWRRSRAPHSLGGGSAPLEVVTTTTWYLLQLLEGERYRKRERERETTHPNLTAPTPEEQWRSDLT